MTNSHTKPAKQTQNKHTHKLDKTVKGTKYKHFGRLSMVFLIALIVMALSGVAYASYHIYTEKIEPVVQEIIVTSKEKIKPTQQQLKDANEVDALGLFVEEDEDEVEEQDSATTETSAADTNEDKTTQATTPTKTDEEETTPVHEHTWVAQTEQKWVVDVEAHEEPKVTESEEVTYVQGMKGHEVNIEWIKIPEQGHYETVVTGYVCSDCGAEK